MSELLPHLASVVDKVAFVKSMKFNSGGASTQSTAKPEQGPIGPSKAPPKAASAPTSDEGFTYTKPEKWQIGRPGQFRRAAFELSEGKENIEITVSTLSASGSDLLQNINRWCGQIKLDRKSVV